MNKQNLFKIFSFKQKILAYNLNQKINSQNRQTKYQFFYNFVN